MTDKSLIDRTEKNDSYFVGENGLPEGYCDDQSISVGENENPYRLYRFLTELEDILAQENNEETIVKKLIPKVRKLLIESEWIQFEFTPADPKLGWSVNMIYDEPDYPLTVQMVTWSPQQTSPIHNHATWGIVAIISGTEKNTFWQLDRNGGDSAIKFASEQILESGDIIGFTGDAIHQVEALGDQPVISFNLYGITDFKNRYKYDRKTQTATNF